MAPAAFEKPDVAFNTLKREHLFRHPPRDKSAYPALIEAVKPHIESFNALTKDGGLLDLAREDIGVKTTFDGKGQDILAGNRISSGCPLALDFVPTVWLLLTRALVGFQYGWTRCRSAPPKSAIATSCH